GGRRAGGGRGSSFGGDALGEGAPRGGRLVIGREKLGRLQIGRHETRLINAIMFAQVQLFPEQASTNAASVDHLFYFLCGVTGAVALLISVLVVGFALRYRRRSEADQTPRILGSMRLELFWTIAPLFVFFVMFFWGASVYLSLTRPPADAIEVYVVGKQWMWKLQHQGGQREINELHVPVNQPVKLILTSEDVIHD